MLKAIVTRQPLSDTGIRQLIAHGKQGLELAALKGAVLEATQKTWAEHHVCLKTVPTVTRDIPSRRRVGLFVGISQYQDQRIRELSVGHLDARAMHDALKQHGRLDEAILLTNAQATLANVREAICMRLPQLTAPGDLVIIYWSGHGGRVADEDGDEPDGFDEYLVPYDGQRGRIADIHRTMLVDDTFFRWMQGLDGRQIVLLFDTCYCRRPGQGPRRPTTTNRRRPRSTSWTASSPGPRTSASRNGHAGRCLGRSESVRTPRGGVERDDTLPGGTGEHEQPTGDPDRFLATHPARGAGVRQAALLRPPRRRFSSTTPRRRSTCDPRVFWLGNGRTTRCVTPVCAPAAQDPPSERQPDA